MVAPANPTTKARLNRSPTTFRPSPPNAANVADSPLTFPGCSISDGARTQDRTREYVNGIRP